MCGFHALLTSKQLEEIENQLVGVCVSVWEGENETFVFIIIT